MLIAEPRNPKSEYASITRDSFTEEQWGILWEYWPFFNAHGKKTLEEFLTSDNWLISYAFKQARLTYAEAEFFEANGISLKIEGLAGMMLTKMKDRGTAEWDNHQPVTAASLANAKTIQIAVPDVGLLLIDEVTWLNDACTEELQSRLDEGWRILAVCPPNAQRRPDYILGRRR